MPGTFLNFPFDEELFNMSWGQAPDPTKLAMIQSGALVEDSLIASMIQSEGNFYTIPFYNTLDGDPTNYDGQTDIATAETAGDTQSGVVFGRAKGFTARNFVAELTGADPMGNITANIARYWQKQDQARLLNILAGVFSVTGASGKAKTWHDNHIVDLGSATATPYKIGVTDLNELATEALGDNKSLFSLAIMHSNVAKTLENLQLLEYWKQTDANGIQRSLAIGTVNGYTVIIDDGVPATVVGGAGENKDLTKYTTYLLGAGVLRNAQGRVDIPSEVFRDPKANGGQDTLYTRTRKTFHPNGFEFVKPASGFSGSPTDEQLAAAANWNIKFDPKAIPMAEIITNG